MNNDIFNVAFGLGSNLGDRQGFLQAAIDQLGFIRGLHLTAVSALYETISVGNPMHRNYYNAVATGVTTLPAHGLLDLTQAIEVGCGRVRHATWSPRSLDIDLLFYGDEVIRSDRLTVPHPLMEYRHFVLIPLSTIAPDWIHPMMKRTVKELLEQAGENRDVQLLTRKDRPWPSSPVI